MARPRKEFSDKLYNDVCKSLKQLGKANDLKRKLCKQLFLLNIPD